MESFLDSLKLCPMKSLYCDVCERHFNAQLSTPNEVAFLKHGNRSQHVNHKKEQADDLSIRSSESEEFVLTNASSFIGLEERRLSVSVASECLNQFSSPNNDAFSESSSVIGLSNFSTSSSNNMYWNAMVSPEKTGLIDFYDSLENYLGEAEGEEEVFEDDRSISLGTERSNGYFSQSEKSYVDSESAVSVTNDDVISIYSATERRSSLNSDTHSDVLGSDGDFDGYGNYRRMNDNDSIHSEDFNYSTDGTEHSEDEDESMLKTSSKLSQKECISNEVLSKQRIIVQDFYNVIPAKFNRIAGKEVNVEIALMALNHIVELNLSDPEGDEFLDVLNKIMALTSEEDSAIPMKTKTLKRAFLSKADKIFPIESIGIKLLPCFFSNSSTTSSRKKDPVPILHKHFRKIEDALALLLLQVNPEDVMSEMKPEFLECHFDGSKERLYTGYSSGDYPIDVQGWINSDFKSKYYGRKPLPLLISIYIDGCLLNSTHTRSAIPVIITILNDKKKSSTVIGFNYEVRILTNLETTNIAIWSLPR